MRVEDNFARQEILFNTRFQNAGNTQKVDNNTDKVGFGQVLSNCINETNSKMVESDSATNSFIKGEDVSIDEVMIKNQEASLALQFLTQTRDKLLEGYETLSKLQL